MATVNSWSDVADWFSSTTPRNITGVSWNDGDMIIAWGANEGEGGLVNAPTNANLTFTLRDSSTGGTSESESYIWSAPATSTETSQTIACSSNSNGNFGVCVWVLRPGTDKVFEIGNSHNNRDESSPPSLSVSADSIVCYGGADWNATNPPGKTPATGSGTSTERLDQGNGASYAQYVADWVGTSATSTTFGPNNYTSLKIAEVALEIKEVSAVDPRFIAAGTAASGTGAVTPGAPAGIVDDDLLILVIEGEGEDANADSAPTGGDWTAIDGSTGSVANDTAGSAWDTRCTVYYHVYDSASPPSYSVPDAGEHTLAQVLAFRNVDTTTPIGNTQSSSADDSNTSVSITGVTTGAANAGVLVVFTNGDDVTASGWTNSNLVSIDELTDESTTSGSDGSIHAAFGLKATAGATGATTATVSANEREAGWTIELKKAGGATNATVTPSVVTGTGEIPAPTVATGVTVTVAAAVTGVGEVPAPTVGAGVGVSPATADGVGEISAPTVATGVTVTATATTGVGEVPAPTVATGVTVTATATTGAGEVPAPTVATGAALSPATVDGVGEISAPTVATGVTVTATATTGTGEIPLPTVTTDSDATVTLSAAVTGTGEIPLPTIGAGVGVSPATVDGVGEISAPTVATGASVSPGVIDGTGSVLAPTIATGVTVTASTVTGTGEVLTVTIVTGTASTDTVIVAVYKEHAYTETYTEIAVPATYREIGFSDGWTMSPNG
jgi:hypothetical protein